MIEIESMYAPSSIKVFYFVFRELDGTDYWMAGRFEFTTNAVYGGGICSSFSS